MWNLFSAVEPKVIKPARSLKQQLLYQQQKALKSIQQDARKMLNSINTILKTRASKPTSSDNVSKSQPLDELQSIVGSLYSRIQTDNNRFEEYIRYRDQQKMNQQQFFKETMKSYELKKSELNKHIEELQDKVQQLQLIGFKTYQTNPKPNNVLSGINLRYIEKYLIKLQELKRIEQGIEMIVTKNRQKHIKDKSTVSSKDFPSLNNHNKLATISTSGKFNSLNDLQKQLQNILLKEQIIGDLLSKKIRKCKNTFQKLAFQQKVFKDSLKKIGVLNEQKRRSSLKLAATSKGFNEQLQSLNNSLKKTSSFIGLKQNTNDKELRSLNPSIDNQKIEFNEKQQSSEFNQQIDIQAEHNQQQQIPSQNFIQACQFLITERFIQDDQNKKQSQYQLDQEEN